MPSDCLLLLYDAFLLSNMSYCIIIWGNACKKYVNPLILLQKKAICVICNTFYLSHFAPLAKQCDILFVTDVYTVFIYKYMYNVFHNNTVYDLRLFCHPVDVHSHNTRNVNHNYFVFPVHTLP